MDLEVANIHKMVHRLPFLIKLEFGKVGPQLVGDSALATVLPLLLKQETLLILPLQEVYVYPSSST